MRISRTPALLLLCCLLAACDQLAELDGSKAIEAEGKAVGGACRHAGRALEDCYALNERASKAAVFTGWREMNNYMTENKIEVIAPQIAKKPRAKSEEHAAVDGQTAPMVIKEGALARESGAAKGASGSKPQSAGKDGAQQYQLPAGIPSTTPDKPGR